MIVNFTDEMNDYQVISWQIYKERFSMTIKFVETILCFDGNTLAFFIFQSKNDIHCTKEILLSALILLTTACFMQASRIFQFKTMLEAIYVNVWRFCFPINIDKINEIDVFYFIDID